MKYTSLIALIFLALFAFARADYDECGPETCQDYRDRQECEACVLCAYHPTIGTRKDVVPPSQRSFYFTQQYIACDQS